MCRSYNGTPTSFQRIIFTEKLTHMGPNQGHWPKCTRPAAIYFVYYTVIWHIPSQPLSKNRYLPDFSIRGALRYGLTSLTPCKYIQRHNAADGQLGFGKFFSQRVCNITTKMPNVCPRQSMAGVRVSMLEPRTWQHNLTSEVHMTNTRHEKSGYNQETQCARCRHDMETLST